MSAISCSFARLAPRDLLAASLFFLRRSQYVLSLPALCDASVKLSDGVNECDALIFSLNSKNLVSSCSRLDSDRFPGRSRKGGGDTASMSFGRRLFWDAVGRGCWPTAGSLKNG